MLPFANTRAMQMHLDEISCNVAATAHAVVLMDRAGMARHRQTQGPQKPHHHPAAVPLARAEPGREHLAIPASKLALKPRFRRLRRHHRGWLPSLEQAHRSTRNHHVHRNERLGPTQVNNCRRWYKSRASGPIWLKPSLVPTIWKLLQMHFLVMRPPATGPLKDCELHAECERDKDDCGRSLAKNARSIS